MDTLNLLGSLEGDELDEIVRNNLMYEDEAEEGLDDIEAIAKQQRLENKETKQLDEKKRHCDKIEMPLREVHRKRWDVEQRHTEKLAKKQGYEHIERKMMLHYNNICSKQRIYRSVYRNKAKQSLEKK